MDYFERGLEFAIGMGSLCGSLMDRFPCIEIDFVDDLDRAKAIMVPERPGAAACELSSNMSAPARSSRMSSALRGRSRLDPKGGLLSGNALGLALAAQLSDDFLPVFVGKRRAPLEIIGTRKAASLLSSGSVQM